MDAQAIVTVSAATVALTQLLKWGRVPDKFGPVLVLSLSLVGVVFYIWTRGAFERAHGFDYFSAWIAVATSASGVYGFTRASGVALTKLLPPPGDGAGSSPTTDKEGPQ